MFRYERKYLVPNYMLDNLRSRFNGFVRPDIAASANGNGIPQYTVRSIYFDSPDLLYYNEKHDGLMKRRKLRVRGYNKNGNNEKVVLEIKRKTGNRISKNRAAVAYNNLEQLLNTGLVETFIEDGFGKKQEDALDDARRFLFHLKLMPMIPTTLVSYEREAYHGKLNAGNRVTFDKNIRSKNHPELNELYKEEGMRYLFKSHFIMEIKYFEDQMPSWAKSIVHEFRLRNEALSKYVIGYDVNKTFAHI